MLAVSLTIFASMLSFISFPSSSRWSNSLYSLKCSTVLCQYCILFNRLCSVSLGVSSTWVPATLTIAKLLVLSSISENLWIGSCDSIFFSSLSLTYWIVKSTGALLKTKPTLPPSFRGVELSRNKLNSWVTMLMYIDAFEFFKLAAVITISILILSNCSMIRCRK